MRLSNILRMSLLASFGNNFCVYSKYTLRNISRNVIKILPKLNHLYIISLSIPGLNWTHDKVSKNTSLLINKYWSSNDISLLIEEADNLYNDKSYVTVYEYLNRMKYQDNVEILWRICRVLYKLSLDMSLVVNIRHNMINEAFDIISHALEITNDNPNLHKWMAIILNAKCGLEGTAAKVKNALTIKKHMMRAVELDPNDVSLLHMLGKWCYDFTDLSWVQRKITTVLYMNPPMSSYEEAFDYFLRAEEISPRFYIGNLVMLGKISLKLKKYHQAHYYLHIAQHFPVYTEEEKLLAQEASKLAKQLTNYDLSQDAL